MLECCRHASPVDNDVDLSVHLANATFAAVSGRGQCLRLVQSIS